jgi:Tfp pilus assembly protein PilF
MKKAASLLLGLALGAVIANLHASHASARSLGSTTLTQTVIAAALQGRSSISGFIFDSSRRPLPDVQVELMDDVYGSLRRMRTDASGRYIFQGLSDGYYKVKVMPYGTDYREEIRDVSIINISLAPGSGASSEQLDFYLRLKPNLNAGPLAAPGVVFAQAVPDEAKKFYQLGVSALGNKKDQEGFDNLKRALELFPNYYLALERLGTEYVVRGHHQAAFVLLTKAVEVNKNGFPSMFGLGMALYHLGLYDKSVETLERAAGLYNSSSSLQVGLQVYLGKALKRTGKPTQAETAFKRAKDLSEGKSAEVYWQLAGLYSEQQRYAEAADALELFLKYQRDTRDAEKIKESIKTLREKARTQKTQTSTKLPVVK